MSTKKITKKIITQKPSALTREIHSCNGAVRKIFYALFAVLIVYLIAYIGVLTRNELVRGRYADISRDDHRPITIEVTGRTPTTYDLTEAKFEISTEGSTVGGARSAGDGIVAGFRAGLTAIGISDSDVRVVDHGVYPRYDYGKLGVESLKDFRLDYDVIVRVRDTSHQEAILGMAEDEHVDSFGGFVLTTDSPYEDVKQARAIALMSARERVLELGNLLGVRFGRVSGYYEQNSYDYPDLFDTGSGDTMVRVQITFDIE